MQLDIRPERAGIAQNRYDPVISSLRASWDANIARFWNNQEGIMRANTF